MSCHIGGWYGGPGLWCECGTQDCGYCGSILAAKVDEETFDKQYRVVIDLDEVIAKVNDIPLYSEPADMREAFVALLEGLGAA